MGSYFEFKQFRVDQELCGMKVTTEACILGAWVSVGSAKKAIFFGNFNIT